jgi:5S rRNA maturation endonuclease (ribonuclease M5)
MAFEDSKFNPYTPSRQLECERASCPCRKTPSSGWASRHCPAHDDRHPSLRVLFQDGRIAKAVCLAKCDPQAVRQALGLNGVTGERPRRKPVPPEMIPNGPREWLSRHLDLNVQDIRDLAARYGLRGLKGLHRNSDGQDAPAIAFVWPGLDARKVRIYPKDFVWEGTSRPVLWPSLSIIRKAFPDSDGLVIVEGEFDALILLYLGIPTVSVTGGADTPIPTGLGRELVQQGFKKVLILADADRPGIEAGRRWAKALREDDLGVRVETVVSLGLGRASYGEKDVRDAWLSRTDLDEAAFMKPILQAMEGIRAVGEAVREPSVVQVGDWLRVQQEAPSWVVDGLILQGGLTLLIGKPKVGKSTLARSIGLAVALGRPILGRQVRQGPVLMLTHHREDPPAAVREHLLKMGVREGDAVPLYIADGVQALGDILAWVETNRPALIVIDTIARYTSFEDVNDYTKVLAALEPLQDLARQYGTAVLALHHAPKTGDDRETIDSPLGSTALAGSADVIMRYRRTGDRRILQTVNRFGDDLPETVITLGPDGWPEAIGSLQEVQASEEERAILDAIAANGPMTKDELREALGRKAIDLVRTLQALLRQGRIGRTGSGRKGDPYRYFLIVEHSVEHSVPASTDEASCGVDTEKSGMAVGETLWEWNSVYGDEESGDSVPDSGPLYGNGGNGIFEAASDADLEGEIPFPLDGKRNSAGSPSKNGVTTSPNSVPACTDAISDEFFPEKPDGSKRERKSDGPPPESAGLNSETLQDGADGPGKGSRPSPAPGPPQNGRQAIDPEVARLCMDCWGRGVIKFGWLIGPDGRRRCRECLLLLSTSEAKLRNPIC